MAEVKNNFVKSKMNKDLDDRLLSNGEYREAQNVNVNRSEGEDVGALENVLGNKLFTNFGLNSIDNLEIIGYLADDTNNRAFFIATNYTDFSDDMLSNVAPYGAACYILMADLANNTNQILAQGKFLNFSKTHPVFGINLVEDLLFWTDNRNQPRKINVKTAITNSGYYTTEDQISVAKYYPYSAPFMYDTLSLTNVVTNGTRICTNSVANPTTLRAGMQILTPSNFAQVTSVPVFIVSVDYSTTGTGVGNFIVSKNLSAGTNNFTFIYPTSQNRTDEFITPSESAKFDSITSGPSTSFTVAFSEQTSPLPSFAPMSLQNNMLVTCPGKINEKVLTTGQPSGVEAVYVDKNISASPNSVVAGDILQFSYPNPNYTSTWPGDKELLTDKFVRFAYRFKFDDGEYSVISPFTQPAFIPKQDGYIISEPTNNDPTNYSNQEEAIGASTIISFFENKVDDVTIRINTPYLVNQLVDKLKVSEIDILYKESDGLAIQVLETIPVSDASITSNSTYIYNYTYQSRKPFRTLPASETTRVFDKVPVRAMSQSSVGNRIVYGNIIDKHSPPENINYSVSASPKYNVVNENTSYTTVSTPNHTLKQNRTYQVGIVLSDRYGRQSDVILSSISNFQYSQSGSTETFDGSTVFHSYPSRTEAELKAIPVGSAGRGWFGDSLKVLFNEKIPSSIINSDNAPGYPGLYKSGIYNALVTNAVVDSPTIVVSSIDQNIAVGDIINVAGTIVSIIAIDTNTNTITVSANVSLDANKNIVIHGPENKLGWYSYKIVVKQQAEEYYNAYLANICSIPTTITYNATYIGTSGASTSSIVVSDPSDIVGVKVGDEVTGPGITVPIPPNPSGSALPAKVTSVTGADTLNLDITVTIAGSQALVIKTPSIAASSYISDQSFYTTLISDNVNKIPADLEEVQPEQTQFRTSDVVLYPRITAGNYVFNNKSYNSQRYLGTKFATANTIGKITDLGLQQLTTLASGDTADVTPISSPGLFQAQTNPPTAILLADGLTIGGKPSDPLNFSVLEIKPPESRLSIFYETSTSGLISELNDAIEAGPSSSEKQPEAPSSPD
jgi:hypothetical protein